MKKIFEIKYNDNVIILPLSFLMSDVIIYRNMMILEEGKDNKGIELFKKIINKYNEELCINIDELEVNQLFDYLTEFLKYNNMVYNCDVKDGFYVNFYNVVDLWYLDFSKKSVETAKTLYASLQKYDGLIPEYKIDSALQTIQSTILSVAKSISEFFKPAISEVISNTLKGLTDYIGDVFANLDFPGYTEEQKASIKTIFNKWGEYGWCIVGEAPLDVVYNMPVSFDDANDKMSIYYSEKKENEIFEYLTLKINNKYFENAKELYDGKMYLSCSMNLFALIDSYSINLDNNINKKVGKKAIGCLESKIEQSNNVKDYSYLLFDASNLVSCLNKYFENTNNFTENFEVINRNYVMHGMHNKSVNKLECKKLFLLLYSLLKFEEAVNEMGGF